MTPESQRIAIAEACGWKRELSKYGTRWKSPQEKHFTSVYSTVHKDGINQIPDYLSDLNAIHEAEKVLVQFPGGRLQHNEYLRQLANVCESGASDFHVFATATQRAEAFLRTLGLWDDAKLIAPLKPA